MKHQQYLRLSLLAIFCLQPIHQCLGQSEPTDPDNEATRSSEASLQISHLALASATTPGADMVVAWSGPGSNEDAIYVYQIGGSKALSKVSARAEDFKPAIVKAPMQAGDYELRLKSGDEVLATALFTVVVGKAKVKVLTPIVIAGETVDIEWDGPRNSGDNLSISLVGSADEIYKQPASGSIETKLSLRAPVTAGLYEVRLQDRSSSILAKHNFEVR
jgi:hypothetical protein